LKKRNNGELPSGFDTDAYAVVVRPRAVNEAKWMFIQDKVMATYPDLEITKEDVDGYLATEAAKYGLPVDMIRNFYAQSGDQLENLRNTIRSQKLFDKLAQDVTPNPLSKDAYQKKNS
jgi:FKBP-type peptidyl-prolyl cis-trans isomerase (trigger factor)